MIKDEKSLLDLEKELKGLGEKPPLLEEETVKNLLEVEESISPQVSPAFFGMFSVLLVLLAPLYMHVRKYLFKYSKRKDKGEV